MRKVESGRLRGRRLATLPRNVAVRPTAAKVRSAVFDRLQSHIAGARVLDLFAGSGALSIEALSRGAHHATLVERDRATARFLERQLQTLGLRDVTRVHGEDALAFLRRASVGRIDQGTGTDQSDESATMFDLVLLDPPYERGDLLMEALDCLLDTSWLHPATVIVCERAHRGREPKALPVPPGLGLVATRVYGHTVVDYLATSRSVPLR